MESTEAHLNALKDLGTLIHVRKNCCLHNRAHKDHYVYFLTEGICALHSVYPDGKERIYQYFQPNDLIGFIPVYIHDYPDDTFYAFSITAKSDCTLYQIPFASFRDYIDRCPELYRWLFELTVSHYDCALRHCYALQNGNSLSRLCHALAELAVPCGNHYVLHSYFTYGELANYLGLHTITVTRLMKHLKDTGAIRKQGHTTIIPDIRLLASVEPEKKL